MPNKSKFNFQKFSKYSRECIKKIATGKDEKPKSDFNSGSFRINYDFFIVPSIGIPTTTGHYYDNKYDCTTEQLIWYSKLGTHSKQPKMRKIIDESYTLYCFSRWENGDDFTFLGIGKIISYKDGAPVIDKNGKKKVCIEFIISCKD